MIDRDRFFAAARARPFGGSMTQAQIAGCNAILDGWEARPDLTDPRWLAYMLATAKWETAHTMQPIEEYGHGAGRAYAPTYYGRGYVQLTWNANYQKMSALTGVDLVTHPERALEPRIAALIMFDGMKGGMFTGVGLPKYFNATTDDPVNARRIINGTDKAHEIAEIHREFLAALTGTGASARTVLKKGDQGDAVQALQRALGITPDGDFGPKTDEAVRMFQADQGLEVDGIVGKQTRQALGLA